MAISDEERRMFEELQRDFVKDDPAFARRMSSAFHPARFVLVSTLIFLAGFIILLSGISMNNILVGITGFGLMVYSPFKAVPRLWKAGEIQEPHDDDDDGVKT